MTGPEWSGVSWKREFATGDRTFRWGRLGTDYVGEWVGILALRAGATGTIKEILPHPDISKSAVEKATRGEAAAFVRWINGGLSLHASAVAWKGKALVLTGLSGAGKSTVASQLCENIGVDLLADDVAGIDLGDMGPRVVPGERHFWLSDGRGDKRPTPARVATEPAAISSLVSLSFDDALRAPALRPVRGGAIVAELLDAFLRFDLATGQWEREFELLAGLSAEAKIFRLVRPRTTSAEETARLAATLLQERAREWVS